jgi:hypothetical protein
MTESITQKLVMRGNQVSIEHGKLRIEPASGKPVPDHWLKDHSHAILIDILGLLALNGFLFDSFTTGRYNLERNENSRGTNHKRMAGGVCLQFRNLLSGQPCHAIFNANLDYTRGKKEGTPLPGKQFRVTKNMEFFKFWIRARLPLPNRLSKFHDHMGNLKGLLFTGNIVNGEKLANKTITPLCLDSGEIARLIQANKSDQFPDYSRTAYGQVPDNIRTSNPDKQSLQPQELRDYPPEPTTCVFNHGNTVTRGRGNKGNVIPLIVGKDTRDKKCVACDGEGCQRCSSIRPNSRKPPQEQSEEEWLADYGKV